MTTTTNNMPLPHARDWNTRHSARPMPESLDGQRAKLFDLRATGRDESEDYRALLLDIQAREYREMPPDRSA